MANISHRVGKINERLMGRKELLGSYDRFKDHLRANDMDVDKMISGPTLTMDPARERQQAGVPRLPQAVRRA